MDYFVIVVSRNIVPFIYRRFEILAKRTNIYIYIYIYIYIKRDEAGGTTTRRERHICDRTRSQTIYMRTCVVVWAARRSRFEHLSAVGGWRAPLALIGTRGMPANF